MPNQNIESRTSTPNFGSLRSPDPNDESVDFFLARQPIFKSDGTVYGYELLFRSCRDNVFDGTEANLASSHVITSSFFSAGTGKLLSGKKAFINFPADLLIAGIPLLLSPQLAVVEILETIEVDAKVIAACRMLNEKGYLLALDDFSGQSNFDSLLDIADIIKVDFQVVRGADRRKFVEAHRARGVKMLAEKVETQEEFDSARADGYTYFQGFFFARPKLVRGREIAGFKLNYLRILVEIHRADLDYDEIVNVINQEVSLASKLLRYINSAAFCWRGNVSSIHQALALLGDRAIRHWVSTAALLAMARDKPGELIVHAILRARFCESIGRRANISFRHLPTLFLIGMFSLLDAILDRPLDELLAELPLSSVVRNVLLGTAPQGDRWAEVYTSVRAYEVADWETLSAVAGRLGIPSKEFTMLYFEAAEWSARVFHSASASSA